MNQLRADAIPAGKSWAYIALTKPDVTFLVVITTVAGFYLGSSGPMDWLLLMHTLCGTLLVAGGTAALNQYVERDMDAVMRRTASRPLPSGQLQPREVLIFGFSTIVLGAGWLAMAVNSLSAMIALATSVLYLCLYTPLKTRTTLATAVGAIPGALPPLIGWAAAHHSLSLGGMGALRDSVLLAVSAFHGHCLDVSRRLRSRRNTHASSGGSDGQCHVPADHLHLDGAGVGERVAISARDGQRALFRSARWYWA